MRTSADLVAKVLKQDYNPDDSLVPFVEAASAMVDAAVACAKRKKLSIPRTVQELLERWVAAHCYCMSEGKYSQRSEGGASVSGSFQGQTGMYGEATTYGQTAMTIDATGCMRAVLMNKRARLGWLGKPKSQQTEYEDRN